MDRDTAALIVRRATESSRALATLPYALKNVDIPQEYGDIRDRIAEVLSQINESLIEPILTQHPDLREERERHMERFGSFL